MLLLNPALTSQEDLDSSGGSSWSIPAKEALQSLDGVFASIRLANIGTQKSKYLMISEFQPSEPLPTKAKISKLFVEVYWSCTSESNVDSVCLLSNNKTLAEVKDLKVPVSNTLQKALIEFSGIEIPYEDILKNTLKIGFKVSKTGLLTTTTIYLDRAVLQLSITTIVDFSAIQPSFLSKFSLSPVIRFGKIESFAKLASLRIQIVPNLKDIQSANIVEYFHRITNVFPKSPSQTAKFGYLRARLSRKITINPHTEKNLFDTRFQRRASLGSVFSSSIQRISLKPTKSKVFVRPSVPGKQAEQVDVYTTYITIGLFQTELKFKLSSISCTRQINPKILENKAQVALSKTVFRSAWYKEFSFELSQLRVKQRTHLYAIDGIKPEFPKIRFYLAKLFYPKPLQEKFLIPDFRIALENYFNSVDKESSLSKIKSSLLIHPSDIGSKIKIEPISLLSWLDIGLETIFNSFHSYLLLRAGAITLSPARLDNKSNIARIHSSQNIQARLIDSSLSIEPSSIAQRILLSKVFNPIVGEFRSKISIDLQSIENRIASELLSLSSSLAIIVSPVELQESVENLFRISKFYLLPLKIASDITGLVIKRRIRASSIDQEAQFAKLGTALGDLKVLLISAPNSNKFQVFRAYPGSLSISLDSLTNSSESRLKISRRVQTQFSNKSDIVNIDLRAAPIALNLNTYQNRPEIISAEVVLGAVSASLEPINIFSRVLNPSVRPSSALIKVFFTNIESICEAKVLLRTSLQDIFAKILINKLKLGQGLSLQAALEQPAVALTNTVFRSNFSVFTEEPKLERFSTKQVVGAKALKILERLQALDIDRALFAKPVEQPTFLDRVNSSLRISLIPVASKSRIFETRLSQRIFLVRQGFFPDICEISFKNRFRSKLFAINSQSNVFELALHGFSKASLSPEKFALSVSRLHIQRKISLSSLSYKIFTPLVRIKSLGRINLEPLPAKDRIVSSKFSLRLQFDTVKNKQSFKFSSSRRVCLRPTYLSTPFSRLSISLIGGLFLADILNKAEYSVEGFSRRINLKTAENRLAIGGLSSDIQVAIKKIQNFASLENPKLRNRLWLDQADFKSTIEEISKRRLDIKSLDSGFNLFDIRSSRRVKACLLKACSNIFELGILRNIEFSSILERLTLSPIKLEFGKGASTQTTFFNRPNLALIEADPVVVRVPIKCFSNLVSLSDLEYQLQTSSHPINSTNLIEDARIARRIRISDNKFRQFLSRLQARRARRIELDSIAGKQEISGVGLFTTEAGISWHGFYYVYLVHSFNVRISR